MLKIRQVLEVINTQKRKKNKGTYAYINMALCMLTTFVCVVIQRIDYYIDTGIPNFGNGQIICTECIFLTVNVQWRLFDSKTVI